MMAERPGPEGAKAAARLQGPDVPDALEYLWERFAVLDGMRTYTMGGANPITADAIRATAELYGWTLDRLELDAIRVLDGVIRSPDTGTETSEAEREEAPAWPEKKG